MEGLRESPGVTRSERAWKGAEVWFVLTPGFGHFGYFAKPQRGELYGHVAGKALLGTERAFHSWPERADQEPHILTLCVVPISGPPCAHMTGKAFLKDFLY